MREVLQRGLGIGELILWVCNAVVLPVFDTVQVLIPAVSAIRVIDRATRSGSRNASFRLLSEETRSAHGSPAVAVARSVLPVVVWLERMMGRGGLGGSKNEFFRLHATTTLFHVQLTCGCGGYSTVCQGAARLPIQPQECSRSNSGGEPEGGRRRVPRRERRTLSDRP